MTIQDDNIQLTGERVLSAETNNSVIRYITFTASSVSESSVLTYSVDTQEEWNVSVSLVRCINDTSGKTYAIRIECPFFTVGDMSLITRTVTVEGYVYTNIRSIFSSVYETFSVTGCFVDPYTYLLYKTRNGGTINPRYGGFDIHYVRNEQIPDSGGWCRFVFEQTPTEITRNAFADQPQLMDIKLIDSIETIRRGAFNAIVLTGVTLNDGLKTIEERAFVDCGTITINVPDSVTSMDCITFDSNIHIYYYGPLADDCPSETPGVGAHWGAGALN